MQADSILGSHSLTELFSSMSVSFHKGCYIGQELTARTYHTGVIRKRVVPFTVQGLAKNITVQEGNPVITSSGKKAGKVCAFHGQYGMGVLRLELVKSEEKLFVEDGRGNGVEVSADLPSWWPKESQWYWTPGCEQCDSVMLTSSGWVFNPILLDFFNSIALPQRETGE